MSGRTVPCPGCGALVFVSSAAESEHAPPQGEPAATGAAEQSSGRPGASVHPVIPEDRDTEPCPPPSMPPADPWPSRLVFYVPSPVGPVVHADQWTRQRGRA